MLVIGWPIAAEQFYTVKMLEEDVGVCVEMVRGNCSKIDKGRMKEVIIDIVMGETEKGEKMRRKALEIKEMIKAVVREVGRIQGFFSKSHGCFHRQCG
ncbi:hypothetical protein AAC387_Pa06g1140 [Persea americana]